MPYMEFYQGLRERNWTSDWYQQDAPPWRVQIFQDSGRFMAPAFSGYRCARGPAGPRGGAEEELAWVGIGLEVKRWGCGSPSFRV